MKLLRHSAATPKRCVLGLILVDGVIAQHTAVCEGLVEKKDKIWYNTKKHSFQEQETYEDIFLNYKLDRRVAASKTEVIPVTKPRTGFSLAANTAASCSLSTSKRFCCVLPKLDK